MEIDLAFLADAATIDASGKLSVLGIFDRIGVSQFPAQHGRITLVLRFTAGTSEMVRMRCTSGCRIPAGRRSCP